MNLLHTCPPIGWWLQIHFLECLHHHCVNLLRAVRVCPPGTWRALVCTPSACSPRMAVRHWSSSTGFPSAVSHQTCSTTCSNSACRLFAALWASFVGWYCGTWYVVGAHASVLIHACLCHPGVKSLLDDEAVMVGGKNHSHATQVSA